MIVIEHQIEVMSKACAEHAPNATPWNALPEQWRANIRAGIRAALAVLPDPEPRPIPAVLKQLVQRWSDRAYSDRKVEAGEVWREAVAELKKAIKTLEPPATPGQHDWRHTSTETISEERICHAYRCSNCGATREMDGPERDPGEAADWLDVEGCSPAAASGSHGAAERRLEALEADHAFLYDEFLNYMREVAKGRASGAAAIARGNLTKRKAARAQEGG